MMGAKLCVEVGCMGVTLGGARCPSCERAYQRARNASPARKPRRTRAYMDTVIPVGASCWCCGSTEDLTRHHVDPLVSTVRLWPDGVVRYADPGPDGLVPMCRRCNSSIGANRMAGLACPMHGGTIVEGGEG